MRKTRFSLCCQFLLRKKQKNQNFNPAGMVRLAIRKSYKTWFLLLGRIKCWSSDPPDSTLWTSIDFLRRIFPWGIQIDRKPNTNIYQNNLKEGDTGDESTVCTLRMSLKQGIKLKIDKINLKFKMCKKCCWKGLSHGVKSQLEKPT